MNDVNIKQYRHEDPETQQTTTTLVLEELCEGSDGLCPLKNTVIIHMVFVGNLNVSTLQNRSTYLLADDTACVSLHSY